MYIGFQHLHSTLAWVVLALLFAAVGLAKYGWFFKKPWTETQRKVTLFAMIGAHTQLLIGLVLYVISPVGLSALSGEAMGNATLRLYSLEHPLVNILALVLITIGHVKAKKATTDASKHAIVMWTFGIGLLLILSRIPYAAWLPF
jgi:hypothetical protein